MPKLQSPDYKYLVMSIGAVEDQPLRLLSTRVEAVRYAYKLVTPDQKTSDQLFIQITVFRNGRPEAIITQDMITLEMEGKSDHAQTIRGRQDNKTDKATSGKRPTGKSTSRSRG